MIGQDPNIRKRICKEETPRVCQRLKLPCLKFSWKKRKHKERRNKLKEELVIPAIVRSSAVAVKTNTSCSSLQRKLTISEEPCVRKVGNLDELLSIYTCVLHVASVIIVINCAGGAAERKKEVSGRMQAEGRSDFGWVSSCRPCQ